MYENVTFPAQGFRKSSVAVPYNATARPAPTLVLGQFVPVQYGNGKWLMPSRSRLAALSAGEPVYPEKSPRLSAELQAEILRFARTPFSS